MNPEVPAPGVDERLAQALIGRESDSANQPLPAPALSEMNETPEGDLDSHADLLDQASCLTVKAKVALIRKLMTQLETDQIQTVLESGLREIGERQQRGATAIGETHNTRLLLKKDYSYQDRGLSEPTQYYVYLRRRKPKLDRYIGTLFYIPQGCTLSYFLDAEGQIVFNSPHNIFQLRDSNNPEIVQIVRLICLQPPPPDYTFTKQQQDTPQIYLHLEYLDPNTHQPIAKQAYPFPVCMYENGPLDRYRWEVSTLAQFLQRLS